jgi:hypothetical protein
VNVFLPYCEIAASVRCLDDLRLGKQLVECQQILNVLRGRRKGYANHPAVVMFRGHEGFLLEYALEAAMDWEGRKHKTHGSWIAILRDEMEALPDRDATSPWWFGEPWFHITHQRNLVRKDPARYGPLFPGRPPMTGYPWPKEQVGVWDDKRLDP